jgi:hypothetical protein
MNKEQVVRHCFSRCDEESLNPLCSVEVTSTEDSLSSVIPADRSQWVAHPAEHHLLPLHGSGDEVSDEESKSPPPGAWDEHSTWRQDAADALSKAGLPFDEQDPISTTDWPKSGDASMNHSELIWQTGFVEWPTEGFNRSDMSHPPSPLKGRPHSSISNDSGIEFLDGDSLSPNEQH